MSIHEIFLVYPHIKFNVLIKVNDITFFQNLNLTNSKFQIGKNIYGVESYNFANDTLKF